MNVRTAMARVASAMRGERFALMVGFGISIASTIAIQVCLQPASDRRAAVADDLAATWSDLKLLRAAEAFQQLATLFDGAVYMTRLDWDHDPAGSSAAADVMQRALHGRHAAVKTYLVQLASAHQIDFAASVRDYDALIAAEKANWSFATYQAANAYPGDLALRTTARIGTLASAVWHLEPSLFQARAEENRWSLIIALGGSAGATVLFLLALATSGPRAGPAAGGAPIDVAVEVIALALAEARRRIDAERRA